jgi:hypothetical protein
MSFIFIFIDGVGIGEKNDRNPFSLKSYDFIEQLTEGSGLLKNSPEIKKDKHLFKGIDANLNIEGLPQSGTGQTALFTGENAAQVIGKHFGPFPHSGIKPLLKEKSIYHALQQKGLSCRFMNAYPPIFFEHAEKRKRWSCTTLMARSADLPIYREEDIRKGDGITADIIQKGWQEHLGIDIPEIYPEEAAERLIKQAEEHDFVFYEYYLTDKAGHSRDPEKADLVLQVLNSFLRSIMEMMGDKDTLLISSDHGNLEDLSVKTHTRNAVPLWVKGEKADLFSNVTDLTGVKPKIIEYFEGSA